MKDCPPLASPAAPQGCAMEVYAASAKAKAIAYSSTEIRCRCKKKDRSGGNASVRCRTDGTQFVEIPGYNWERRQGVDAGCALWVLCHE
jgi:hypothetical protein